MRMLGKLLIVLFLITLIGSGDPLFVKTQIEREVGDQGNSIVLRVRLTGFDVQTYADITNVRSEMLKPLGGEQIKLILSYGRAPSVTTEEHTLTTDAEGYATHDLTSIFQNNDCVDISLLYEGNPSMQYLETKSTYRYCHTTVIPILNPLIFLQTPGNEQYLFTACLPMFIVMGALLAAMYATGMDPTLLLDIMTPRLPRPGRKKITGGTMQVAMARDILAKSIRTARAALALKQAQHRLFDQIKRSSLSKEMKQQLIEEANRRLKAVNRKDINASKEIALILAETRLKFEFIERGLRRNARRTYTEQELKGRADRLVEKLSDRSTKKENKRVEQILEKKKNEINRELSRLDSEFPNKRDPTYQRRRRALEEQLARLDTRGENEIRLNVRTTEGYRNRINRLSRFMSQRGAELAKATGLIGEFHDKARVNLSMMREAWGMNGWKRYLPIPIAFIVGSSGKGFRVLANDVLGHLRFAALAIRHGFNGYAIVDRYGNRAIPTATGDGVFREEGRYGQKNIVEEQLGFRPLTFRDLEKGGILFTGKNLALSLIEHIRAGARKGPGLTAEEARIGGDRHNGDPKQANLWLYQGRADWAIGVNFMPKMVKNKEGIFFVLIVHGRDGDRLFVRKVAEAIHDPATRRITYREVDPVMLIDGQRLFQGSAAERAEHARWMREVNSFSPRLFTVLETWKQVGRSLIFPYDAFQRARFAAQTPNQPFDEAAFQSVRRDMNLWQRAWHLPLIPLYLYSTVGTAVKTTLSALTYTSLEQASRSVGNRLSPRSWFYGNFLAYQAVLADTRLGLGIRRDPTTGKIGGITLNNGENVYTFSRDLQVYWESTLQYVLNLNEYRKSLQALEVHPYQKIAKEVDAVLGRGWRRRRIEDTLTENDELLKKYLGEDYEKMVKARNEGKWSEVIAYIQHAIYKGKQAMKATVTEVNLKYTLDEAAGHAAREQLSVMKQEVRALEEAHRALVHDVGRGMNRILKPYEAELIRDFDPLLRTAFKIGERTLRLDLEYIESERAIPRKFRHYTSSLLFERYLWGFYRMGQFGVPSPKEQFSEGIGLVYNPLMNYTGPGAWGLNATFEFLDRVTSATLGLLLDPGYRYSKEYGSMMKNIIFYNMNLPGQIQADYETLRQAMNPRFDAHALEEIRGDIQYLQRKYGGTYEKHRGKSPADIDALSEKEYNEYRKSEAIITTLQRAEQYINDELSRGGDLETLRRNLLQQLESVRVLQKEGGRIVEKEMSMVGFERIRDPTTGRVERMGELMIGYSRFRDDESLIKHIQMGDVTAFMSRGPLSVYMSLLAPFGAFVKNELNPEYHRLTVPTWPEGLLEAGRFLRNAWYGGIAAPYMSSANYNALQTEDLLPYAHGPHNPRLFTPKYVQWLETPRFSILRSAREFDADAYGDERYIGVQIPGIGSIGFIRSYNDDVFHYRRGIRERFFNTFVPFIVDDAYVITGRGRQWTPKVNHNGGISDGSILGLRGYENNTGFGGEGESTFDGLGPSAVSWVHDFRLNPGAPTRWQTYETYEIINGKRVKKSAVVLTHPHILHESEYAPFMTQLEQQAQYIEINARYENQYHWHKRPQEARLETFDAGEMVQQMGIRPGAGTMAPSAIVLGVADAVSHQIVGEGIASVNIPRSWQRMSEAFQRVRRDVWSHRRN